MSTRAEERYDLDRFVKAQDGGVYERALEEIAAGEKSSHWMWFVFPQLQGLGRSATSRKFGLEGAAEARAFAQHGELGPRLYEATEAMLEWAGTMSARDILGPVDALKFKSSMTLFEAACAGDDNQVFSDAIEGFFDGERCLPTTERLTVNNNKRVEGP